MYCCIFFSDGKSNITKPKKDGPKQLDTSVNFALVQFSPLYLRAGVISPSEVI
jgi:hypothetical protein